MLNKQVIPPMPPIKIGQQILIGPLKSPAIVCNEIPTPEDLFGKAYYVVCKSGRGVRARDGQRLGEAVLMEIAWNGFDWAIKAAGYRVSEAMPWLLPYVRRLEELDHGTQQSLSPEDEEIQSDAHTINRSSRNYQSAMHWAFLVNGQLVRGRPVQAQQQPAPQLLTDRMAPVAHRGLRHLGA